MLDNLLTPNRTKRHVFERDHDYLAGLGTARSYWAHAGSVHRLLWNHAALVIRPDAIAGGQVKSIFPMLREHGFVPTVVRPVTIAIAQTEALWRYQSNVATPERRSLLKRLLATGPSIYVILHDQTLRMSAPATVHLTYLKGTAVIKNRRRWHLRTVAGPAVANIFSYVHVSDDPADLLRELAILFAEPVRAEVFAQLAAGVDRTSEALALIATLQRAIPRAALLGCEPAEDASGSVEDRSLRREWAEIVRAAKTCRSFIDGESYVGGQATVPDDKELSLPLDAHLIFRELGPRY